jgi:hypothetical protein
MASNKSVQYWSNRKPSKSNKLVRWERLLTVLGNGGVITLQEIQDTIQYPSMYRIGAEILTLKYNGGVVKAHKNGRNVVGYELVNYKEMVEKHLTSRGFSVAAIVGRDAGISTLTDLNADAQPKAKATRKAKADVETLEVEEITE